MKISIITVTYNRIDTLSRALLSIQNQLFLNKELVVIDGVSVDGSVSMIKTLLTENDIFISEPDDGIYDALNKGITLSSGNIIGIMHSDDFYSDNNVLTEVGKLFENPEIDLVYGDISFFSVGDPEKVLRIYKSGEFSVERLSKGFMPAHTAMFFRKSLYEEMGMYKTDYKIAADYEFLCRVVTSKNLRSVYLPKVMVKMQMGGVSTMGIGNSITLNREVLRACRENGVKTNIFKLLAKYPSKVMSFFLK